MRKFQVSFVALAIAGTFLLAPAPVSFTTEAVAQQHRYASCTNRWGMRIQCPQKHRSTTHQGGQQQNAHRRGYGGQVMRGGSRTTQTTTRRTEWRAVNRVGTGRSVGPNHPSCFTLPTGIRRCPNQ